MGTKARIESLVREIGQIDTRGMSTETLIDNPVVLRLKQQLKQDRRRLAELKKNIQPKTYEDENPKSVNHTNRIRNHDGKPTTDLRLPA